VRNDWTDYLRVHAERRNLLIHLIAVPVFLLSRRWWQQFTSNNNGRDDAA
jgi:uncharacterized membrane protein YGL010W